MPSRAARISLAYLAIAGLWIAASDALVERLVASPALLAEVQTWKGLGFVLVTALCLYVLLRVAPAPAVAAPEPRERLRGALLGLTFFLLAAVITGFGSLAYEREKAAFRERQYAQQAAILKLKAGQVERWGEWQRMSAQTLQRDPDLADAAAAFLHGKASTRAARVAAHFDALLASGLWQAVALFSTDGRLLFATGTADDVNPAMHDAARQAAESGEIRMLDLHRCGMMSSGYAIHFFVPLVPQADKPNAGGVLMLGVDPTLTLFPMVAGWPVPSETSEAFLVRREGDEVVFMTPLWHSDAPPLTLRKPVSLPELPAAQAVRHGEGVMEGVDYRGVAVLSAFRPVAGTNWHIVAKTDVAEVMGPLVRQAKTILAIVLLAVGLAGLFVMLIWRSQRAAHALARAKSREERAALERHFDSLFSQARDIILLIDPEGRIVEANEAAVRAYGYDREELCRMNVRDLRATEAAADFERQFALADSPGGVQFETAHRRRDGGSFPVEVSSRTIDVNGKRYRQSFIRDIGERRRAEAALREQEARLRTVTDAALDAIVMVDADGLITFWNRAAESLFGYAAVQALGRDMHELLTPEAVRQRARAGFAAFVQSGRGAVVGKVTEVVAVHADGRRLPCELAVSAIPLGARWGAVGILRDISARKRQLDEIARLNRAYAMLSQTNGAIIHATEATALFERICHVAVDTGGYLGAWIGMVDEAGKTVLPVASAGTMDEYVRGLVISLEEGRPRGPTALAVTGNQPFWCNDFDNDPATAPWRERAKPFGIRASAALPLRRRNHVVGALNLYSAETNAFDERMQALLMEMADDLSFALENFDRERLRRQAEESMRESEALFRSIVEQNVAAIFMLADGRVRFANPRACEILGYPPGGLDGAAPLELVAEEDREAIAAMIGNVLSGRHEVVERNFVCLRRDGGRVHIGARAVRVVVDGRPMILGVAQDIGERLKAQEEIGRYNRRLQQAMMATVESVATMVEMRDPYTSGHERRVGELAAALGAELGLDENTVTGLRMTGYVHDIGKISIPAEILSKPGRLTELEFEIIKGHARSGYEILKKVEFPWPLPEVILQHHERLDGSGYPQRLKGDEILFEARILAVADVVESMASHRPYRPALGIDKALEEIERNSGRFYDPAVAAACLRLFRDKGYSLPA